MKQTADEVIQSLLRQARRNLGLDVAFVSELNEYERVFRYVDTDSALSPVKVGGSDPADESYCRYVVDGKLPELLSDPSQHPVTAQMAATWELPVGTHVSIPIVLSDGTAYGTLCCFSFTLVDSVAESHVAALRIIAGIVADSLDALEADRREREQRRRRLEALVQDDELLTVYQPIVRLDGGELVGVEALSRFPPLGGGPSSVFKEAWEVGAGVELETKAVESALRGLSHLPPSVYLSVNASPATLASDRFWQALSASDPARVVIEVTEHAAVEDYSALLDTRQRFAQLGVRLAIDDAGAGFSGLTHILRLSPDIIKLDGALVSDVDQCADKQAMLSAVTTFAARTDTAVIAECIESAQELTALRVLGVGYGQGFHLAFPGPLAEVTGFDVECSDIAGMSE